MFCFSRNKKIRLIKPRDFSAEIFQHEKVFSFLRSWKVGKMGNGGLHNNKSLKYMKRVVGLGNSIESRTWKLKLEETLPMPYFHYTKIPQKNNVRMFIFSQDFGI